MATFRLEINKNRPTRNNTFVVWIRITIAGKRKLLKTPIEIEDAEDFNPKAKFGGWITGDKDKKKINENLLST